MLSLWELPSSGRETVGRLAVPLTPTSSSSSLSVSAALHFLPPLPPCACAEGPRGCGPHCIRPRGASALPPAPAFVYGHVSHACTRISRLFSQGLFGVRFLRSRLRTLCPPPPDGPGHWLSGLPKMEQVPGPLRARCAEPLCALGDRARGSPWACFASALTVPLPGHAPPANTNPGPLVARF